MSTYQELNLPKLFMIRTFHKYLSLAISIQLLLWTVSGIYFAFNKIELIRGEQYLSLIHI